MENVPTADGGNLDEDDIATEMANTTTVGNSPDSFQESTQTGHSFAIARCASKSTEMYQQMNDIDKYNVCDYCEDIKLEPQFLAMKGTDLSMDSTSTTSTPCNDADLSNSQNSGLFVKNIMHTNGRCAGTADDVCAVDSITDIEIDIASGVYDYVENSAVRMHSKEESELDVNVCLRKKSNMTEFGQLHTTVAGKSKFESIGEKDSCPESGVDSIKIEVVSEEVSDITSSVDQYVNLNQSHEKDFCKTKPQVKRRSMRLRRDDCVILPSYQAKGIPHSHSDETEKNEKNIENNRSCSGCRLVFKSQALLKKHKFRCPFTTLNASDTAFNCPFCLVYCSTKPILKRHLQSKHPNMDRFSCSFCQIIISPMHDYLEHLQCHQTRNNAMVNNASVISSPHSEFICVECNKNVKNQHLLVIHMLEHKIDKSLRDISQNFKNENNNNDEASSTLNMDLSTSDNGQSTLGNNISPLLPSTSLLTDSFDSFSPELISAVNHSSHVMTFLLQGLCTEWKWTDRTCPKTTEDLLKKFKALSCMSSGITEVSNCLEQLLAEQDQSSGNNIQSHIAKEIKNEVYQHQINENDDFGESDSNKPKDDKDRNNIQSQITKESENNDSQCDADDNIIEGRDVNEQKNVEDEEINNLGDDDNYIPKSMINMVFNAERRVSTRLKRKSDRKIIPNRKCVDFICESTLNTHKVKRVHVSKKSYECIICSKQFRLKNQRQRHYKVHCIEGKFECNSCDYKVKTITAFLKHLANNRDHHANTNTNTNTKVMCIDLPSVTSQIKDENQDASVVTVDHWVSGNKDLLNDKIDGNTKEMFDQTQRVASDGKKEGENGEYVDGENKDLFYDRNTDETHSKIAEKSLSVKNNLSLKKGFACDTCDAVFTQYTSYSQHRMNHELERHYRFKCPVCPESFTQRDCANMHLIIHCKKGDDYKCDHCDFISKDRVAFELHFRGHDSERNYKSCGGENQSCNDSKLKADQWDGVDSNVEVPGKSLNSVWQRMSTKKDFVCVECGMVTKDFAGYKQHIQTHQNHKPHKCTLCPKSFLRRYRLQQHMVIHYKLGRGYKCERCDFTTKTSSVMKLHLLDHETKRIYTCDACSRKLNASDEQPNGEETCGENVDSKRKLSIRTKHNGDSEEINDDKEKSTDPGANKQILCKNRSKRFMVYCRECGKGFPNPNGCETRKTLPEEKFFQCHVCAKCFQTSSHLKRHLIIHNNGDKYKCDYCEFSNNRKGDMVKHIIENHNPDISHYCDVCKFKTRTLYELEQHKKRTHAPKGCKHCSYLACNNSDLLAHVRSTHMHLACPHCNYACYYNTQLKRHIQTHGKDKTKDLVSCELCNFSSNKKRMKYHMIRHSNSKPLTCPDCDYRCSSRASMANHKNMHKGIRPYLCSFCGASFSRDSHLKNHLLVHMKDSKKHACEICGRKFRAKHNLRMHEMIHTGEKRHECHLCPFACRRKRELAHHLKKHGNNATEKEDGKSVVVDDESFKERIVQHPVNR